MIVNMTLSGQIKKVSLCFLDKLKLVNFINRAQDDKPNAKGLFI